jgi:hypothetical protein
MAITLMAKVMMTQKHIGKKRFYGCCLHITIVEPMSCYGPKQDLLAIAKAHEKAHNLE